jgi:hypothetical protein
MKEFEIITNHHWRDFLYRNEVPEKVIRIDFDWLDDEVFDGFIFYRHNYYHVSEFIRSIQFKDWHGCSPDSFFSGILIKLSDDGEQYQIATYIS